MEHYSEFTSEDNLHITSFRYTKIKDIANIISGQFNLIGNYNIKVQPSTEKDSVQLDKRNQADTFIMKWWIPKTTIEIGIQKIFKDMEKNYVSV
jgi:hypothetical protein